MKPKISTALTPANIHAVMAILTETPVQLTRMSASLSPDQLRMPLGEGERTFTEALVHIINSDERSSEMMYMALLVDEPYFADIHPDRNWGKLLKREDLEFAELLPYFLLRRKVLLRVLNALKPDQWGRVVVEQGKQRKESVYWRARTIAYHEHEHIADLDEKLKRFFP